MSDAQIVIAARDVAVSASTTASDAADFAATKAVEVNADRVAAQTAKNDAQAAAAAAGAQMWVGGEAVTTATVRQAPDGSRIRSNAARTTRATFDPTEQGFWTPVLSTAGTLEQVALADTIATELPSPEWSARAKSPLVLSDLRTLHQDVWKDLCAGLLWTRKAPYAAAAQFSGAGVVFNSTTNKIPDYASLTAGLSDNTIITTDRAIFTAVTAVYNLTTDPTRTTNIYSSFTRNRQDIVTTVAPAAGATLEVVGTVLPYQGIWNYSTPTSPTGLYFEVVDFDDTVTTTTSGTGASAIATPNIETPIIPKMPLGNASSLTNNSFLGEGILMGLNFATVGADNRTASQRDTAERNPVVSHDSSSALYGRFRRGFRFYIGGTSSVRGASQTTPNAHFYVQPLGGASGAGAPSWHMNIAHCLVRVVDHLHADSAAFPLGRLFLMVAARHQNGGTAQAGTKGGGFSGVDLYSLPGNPDYLDGMVTL